MSRYLGINDKKNRSITFCRETEKGNFDKNMIKHKSIFEMDDEGMKDEIMYLAKNGISVTIMPI